VSLLHERLRLKGPECLSDFAAEFALVFADPTSGALVLARDAFGLHPLYFARRGRRLAFASDPDVLVALEVASGDLDQGS
jgi:asparagine synthase (glutamine-hydrolysing)